MAIQQLDISGFRSLQEVTWKPGALNILIGPNGSGKSNLLRALVLLKRASEGKLSDTVRGWDGMTALLWDGQAKELRFRLITDPVGENNDPIRHALTYELTLRPVGQTSAFRVEHEWLMQRVRVALGENPDAYIFLERDHGRATMFNSEHRRLESGSELYVEDETLLAQVSDPASYPINTAFRRSLADFQIYHDVHVDSDSEMRRAALLRRDVRVEPDGRNLVNVLHTLYTTDRDFKTELNQSMTAAFGQDFEELVFPPAEDNRIQLRVRWRSLKREQSARDLSDGTLRFLFLITVLAATDLPPVLAIDEPEAGLHPGMLPIVAELATQAARRTQVILTTHSPQLLNAFSGQADVATIVEWRSGKTVLRRLEPDELVHWLENYQLGDLWLAGQLESPA